MSYEAVISQSLAAGPSPLLCQQDSRAGGAFSTAGPDCYHAACRLARILVAPRHGQRRRRHAAIARSSTPTAGPR
jgi:hypothetical protein